MKNISDQHTFQGEVRTDMHCHNCSKSFLALLDYDVDGNHIFECPYCEHEHCRVIKNGKITEDRWDSRNTNPTPITPRRIWKSQSQNITTSATSHFLRDKWLNRGDI